MLIVKLIFTPISPYLTPISPYLRVDIRLPFVYKRYTLGIARSLYADSQVDFHPYITLPHPYITLPHPYITLPHPYITLPQSWYTPPICL